MNEAPRFSLEVEELMKKIQILEAGHDHLKQQVSNLRSSKSSHVKPDKQRTRPNSPRAKISGGGGGRGSLAVNLSDSQYLNILESLGQSVHAMDLAGRVIYWNKGAVNLYGHSAEEALGQFSIKLIVDIRDFGVAYNIIHRVNHGETWTGQFPVKDKSGRRFPVIVTNCPFYDDSGTLVGVICTTADSQPFKEMRVPMVGQKQSLQDSSSSRRASVKTEGIVPQQPLRNGFSSRITNLASKVSNKFRPRIQVRENNIDSKDGSGDSSRPGNGSDSVLSDHMEDTNSIGATTPIGAIPPLTPVGVFIINDCKSPGNPSRDSDGESEEKSSIHKLTSKTEEWPWKGNEQEGIRNTALVWPWIDNDHVWFSVTEKCNYDSIPEIQKNEGDKPANNVGSESWNCPLDIINTRSCNISIRNTSYNALNMVVDTKYWDYEILWEEMIIGRQIGQGACGTVYHGQWDGSDVAVKVFTQLEYSEDVLVSFKQEVSLMKRLRHPNVLLFMGAVTSPERLCIVTELLSRGSLFQLLRKNPSKLDWRRRVNMAMDIAWGMNYLHHFNPPIVHRDLKSSNLLVDRNWTVKVGDFGLSLLKNETFLKTKSAKGTPQWMAPELLRGEASDEKSDVYSYGVILWELATEKIPWDNLNPMQVIAAVGFMNKRLEIPKDVDPQWASIIESCWHSDPASRPTFLELLEKLKALHRHYNIQYKAACSTSRERTQKKY